jgi:hypothetical protein
MGVSCRHPRTEDGIKVNAVSVYDTHVSVSSQNYLFRSHLFHTKIDRYFAYTSKGLLSPLLPFAHGGREIKKGPPSGGPDAVQQANR